MQQRFLDKLICPITKTPLEYHADKQELWSKAAKFGVSYSRWHSCYVGNEARELTDLEVKS